jgi:hypothetical protein
LFSSGRGEIVFSSALALLGSFPMKETSSSSEGFSFLSSLLAFWRRETPTVAMWTNIGGPVFSGFIEPSPVFLSSYHIKLLFVRGFLENGLLGF